MTMIDKEVLLQRINTQFWSEIENIIISAPSIDIVRCKECRWGKPYSDKQLECDALGLGGLKFPDDFCSMSVWETLGGHRWR